MLSTGTAAKSRSNRRLMILGTILVALLKVGFPYYAVTAQAILSYHEKEVPDINATGEDGEAFSSYSSKKEAVDICSFEVSVR